MIVNMRKKAEADEAIAKAELGKAMAKADERKREESISKVQCHKEKLVLKVEKERTKQKRIESDKQVKLAKIDSKEVAKILEQEAKKIEADTANMKAQLDLLKEKKSQKNRSKIFLSDSSEDQFH